MEELEENWSEGGIMWMTETRTVIQDLNSSWLKVTGAILQGSALGPIMFVIHVDIYEDSDSYINLFADNAKLMRRVENVDD